MLQTTKTVIKCFKIVILITICILMDLAFLRGQC